jgi:PAS domain S-box-containing protein
MARNHNSDLTRLSPGTGEDLLHAFLEHIPDGVYFKDRDSRFVRVSRSMATRFGLSDPAEAINKTDFDMFSKEHAELAFADEQEIVRTGRPIVEKEEKETWPDGRESWVLTTKLPLVDGNGEVIGTMGISRDITERKRMERELEEHRLHLETQVAARTAELALANELLQQDADELRQSHRLLQSIMEGVNEVIFVKDLQGRYVMINAPGAQMIGHSVAEVIGKTDFEIVPAETAKAATATDAQVLHTGETHTYEVAVPFPSGVRTFLATKSPHFGPSGEIIGLVGVSLDVTDRRQLEQQIQQAQKMEAIGTLSGGIAHDFNNILTVIKGYTGLLLEGTQDPRQLALVQHIDQAADRASSLTRQLLAYSRRQVLQPKIINLNSLVMNLNKMLQRLIGEDIQMRTVAASNLGSVKADPGQIEQVIMNLAVNARDAMPEGGKLILETTNIVLDEIYAQKHPGTLAGRYVMLAVSDTGVGMDVETRSRIFEPFFTTKGIGRGTGLGLSMVYGIVKQSGGSIEVYSELGQGTTFKIYLPRIEEPAELLAAKESLADRLQGSETILLVEDDAQVRDLAASILTSCGYIVLSADSAHAVISECEQYDGDIHLLLTDVVMPGSGGREIALQVRARRPFTKVLYMSGYTTNAIIHHGVLDPGTHFLQKPFTPATLSAKVREVLDSAQT